jgi:hypothetical protein
MGLMPTLRLAKPVLFHEGLRSGKMPKAAGREGASPAHLRKAALFTAGMPPGLELMVVIEIHSWYKLQVMIALNRSK